ncbi:MAG: hypothetical protein IPM77_02565 [Crocinitomicaceae bacterium]|nr:hypothetical protein [Crocinitomicaceae bacterium]
MLNQEGQILEKILIADSVLLDSNGVIPKSIKPDFEAMALVNDKNKSFLMLFGSGSLSPERDFYKTVSLDDKKTVNTYSLKGIYNQLRDYFETELNIEGVIIFENKIYLLNRFNNEIIRINFEVFNRLINGELDRAPFDTHYVSLPKEENLQPKFSGGCLIPNTSKFLFTATIEDTPNSYDDGEIGNSYVGIIDLTNTSKYIPPRLTKIPVINNSAPVKIESICILDSKKNRLNVAMVTDNDGKASELIFATLEY